MPNGRQGAAAKRAKADAFAARVRPTLIEMQAGSLSLHAMATELSTRGHPDALGPHLDSDCRTTGAPPWLTSG